jgi:putative ABC transport system ATP-binding protein
VSELTRTVADHGETRTIVNNFSYNFHRGKIYTLIGPSGAGKSSILRLLNRLDEPTGGEILIEGQSFRQLIPCDQRAKLGYLFQTPYLFPGSIRDNLKYANAAVSEDEITALAEKARITDFLETSNIDRLSVGERQRVALARLLAIDPQVLLLDEPTAALDPANTAAIEEMIKNMVNRDGLTAIMVTHQPEQALHMESDTLLLVNGRLIEHGTAEQVVNNPESEDGKRYKNRELT